MIKLMMAEFKFAVSVLGFWFFMGMLAHCHGSLGLQKSHC